MIIERNNVFEIIEKACLKPDKDYGQNYLVTPDICSAIVDELNIDENDSVLEIGPGLGSLTHFIINKTQHLTCVDIDKRMTDFLSVIYQKDNISLINNDIRKVDVSSYDKIIGNLPYNITTELVVFLLLNAKSCKKMVLMCQSEAFSRFFDLEGENYGPVSILLHLLGSSKKILTVKPGNFIPAPKCNSLVFSFERSDSDNDLAINTYSLAKTLFLNRRKTIQNNLLNLLKNKSVVETLLNDLGISPMARPENLLPNKYVEIYKYLKNIQML